MRVMFAEAPARAARKCGAAVFGPPSHGKLLSSRQRPMHPGVFCHKNTHESYQGSARDASWRTTLHGWRAGLSHKKALLLEERLNLSDHATHLVHLRCVEISLETGKTVPQPRHSAALGTASWHTRHAAWRDAPNSCAVHAI